MYDSLFHIVNLDALYICSLVCRLCNATSVNAKTPSIIWERHALSSPMAFHLISYIGTTYIIIILIPLITFSFINRFHSYIISVDNYLGAIMIWSLI